MTQPSDKSCCGLKLRSLCFMIGYMHLVSSVLDIACHLLTVAIVTDGFQCDVNYDRFNFVSWTWAEPVLLILNLGTHGFYPFPRIFRHQYNVYVEYMSISVEPKCYPGMLHVYLVDILNFLINLIWLRIVISYIGALHKKNPDPMRMFFSLSVVKLVMQIMYFTYQPHYYDSFAVETYWFLKIIDIAIAAIFLVIVLKYTKSLKAEKIAADIEKPPPYIECLINGNFQSSGVYVGGEKYTKEVTEVKTEEDKEKRPDNVTVN
ncbi:hypothetical protein K1T71_012138 [Dendrolimus kikuchii]|uniref:Uncharacterized protein n=1 Tax=Dendrolimus kikuchii TaxID=765133 RepID=A0ACC1CKX7_9NEOP|nr:hypothetical protein K1T71_012138 [Dendrolimus kikuchii]